MTNKLDTTGKLLNLSDKLVEPKDGGEKYTQYSFLFKVPTGVAEIKISSPDYLQSVIDHFASQDPSVTDLASLSVYLQNNDTPLYFSSSDNYTGYSILESFSKNNKVKAMGADVDVEKVDWDQNGITMKLADGTIARRTFSKKFNDVWYPDLQKQMKFIKDLGVTDTPENWSLDNLINYKVSYVWDKFGDNEFMKIIDCQPKTTQETPVAGTGNSFLDNL